MIYCTTDLHGYSLENFQRFLNKVGFCDDDFLYILGDVIDRGPDSVKLLKWIISKKNVQLILGNHEHMLLGCDFPDDVTDELIANLTGSKRISYEMWIGNSGYVTRDALLTTRASQIKSIMEYLRKAPLYKTLTVNGRNFILVHSGLGNFNKNKELCEYTPDELLWTRMDLNTKYFDDVTLVLGHTPTVNYGNEYLGKILKTDTWIDIDVGVGIGQEPVLLRLDDLKEFYYKHY